MQTKNLPVTFSVHVSSLLPTATETNRVTYLSRRVSTIECWQRRGHTYTAQYQTKQAKKSYTSSMSNTNDEERVMRMPVRDRSVPYGDDKAILEAFEEDGYCVVTGILSKQEVNDMMSELWTSERLLGKFDRHDPRTWSDSSWPQQNGGKNFLQSQNVFQDATPWDLEGNEKLLHVQRLVFGRSDLIMASVGRFGVMRPTAKHPEWRTAASWLHWDQNPHTQPGFFRVQCIVCLTDNTCTSGGPARVAGLPVSPDFIAANSENGGNNTQRAASWSMARF